MSAKDFYQLKDKNDSLLFAALDVAVLLAPYGTALPTGLVDSRGKLKELDPAFKSVGEIEKKAGVDLAPDMKTEGVEGYGSPGTRRDFIADESFDIDFTAQESRLDTMGLYYDLDTSGVVAQANSGFYAKKRRAARPREYSALLIGIDGDPGNEIYPWWIFPKVTMSKKGKQSLSETNVLTWQMTLSAKMDPTFGSLFGFGLCGPGITTDLARQINGTTAGDGKVYKFNVATGSAGTYKITVNSNKVADKIAYDATANTIQVMLRNAGAPEATVAGTVADGFTITGVTGKPTIDVTSLTGVSDAGVAEKND